MAIGNERVVAYGGRSLSKNERKWGITDLEGLALVSGVKHFHVYLANNHFTVITDHQPLRTLRTNKKVTGRLQRWALKLQKYDYSIIFKAGKNHGNADGLSRRIYDQAEAAIDEIAAKRNYREYEIQYPDVIEDVKVKNPQKYKTCMWE